MFLSEINPLRRLVSLSETDQASKKEQQTKIVCQETHHRRTREKEHEERRQHMGNQNRGQKKKKRILERDRWRMQKKRTGKEQEATQGRKIKI